MMYSLASRNQFRYDWKYGSHSRAGVRRSDRRLYRKGKREERAAIKGHRAVNKYQNKSNTNQFVATLSQGP